MQLSRRVFLKVFGSAVGSLAVAPSSVAAPGARRPNIIFFLVDDMGWQDTSLSFLYRNGKPVQTRLNRRYRTPHMEAMARDGMLLTDAYACSICSPTRCSLMSGMSAARHRVTDWTINVNDHARIAQNHGAGLYNPHWAVNGLQPQGTQPSGKCAAPWRVQKDGSFAYGSAQLPYKMTDPYTNAYCLPQALKDAGYFTVHCGKAHWGSGTNNWNTGMGPTSPGADPRSFGFDVNIAGHAAGGPASYRSDNNFGNKDGFQPFDIPGLSAYYGKKIVDLTYKPAGRPTNRAVFLTDVLTDRMLCTLDVHLKQKPNQPFYVYMSHYGIHAPFDNGRAWDAVRSSHPQADQDTECANPKDGLPWNNTERNYHNLLRGMDDSLGTIRRYLADRGIADNTLIVFMADNGGPDRGSNPTRMGNANAPLRAGKGSCYEGGTRECCLALWPGHIRAGSVCSEPLIIEDVYPTLLAAAGVSLPGADKLAVTPAGVYPDGKEVRQVIDGENALPVLLGRRKTVRPDGAPRPLLWHFPNKWPGVACSREYNYYTALRLGNWKLIYQHADRSFELYNLEKDLSESVNLASKQPGLVTRLRRQMAALLRDRGAQMPHIGAVDGPVLPYPDDPALGK